MAVSIHRIKRFLQFIAVLHIVTGAALPWLADSALFAAYHEHLQHAFNTNSLSAHQAGFLVGIFGPTIMSWGVLFLYAVNAGFARPTPQSWWFMLAACVAWAPYDSALSLQHSVYYNAIINAIAFPIIVLPIILARKHFLPGNA